MFAVRLTDKLLLMLVVPVVAPRLSAVAAPPMLRVVAPVLNRFAVEAVVEIVPPFTARLEAAVTSPVRVDVESIVSEPLACMLPVFEIVTPVELYPPPTLSVSILAVADVAASVVALLKFIVVPLIFPVAVLAPIE